MLRTAPQPHPHNVQIRHISSLERQKAQGQEKHAEAELRTSACGTLY